MSKAPNRPRQRDGLNRTNDEGGAPRSSASTRKPRAASKRKAESALESVSAEIPSIIMAEPEAATASSPPPAEDDTLTGAHSLTVGVDLNREIEHGPPNKIAGAATQQAQPVAFAEVPAPSEPNQSVADDLSQPREGVERHADQRHGSTQHHPVAHEFNSGIAQDDKSPSHSGLADTVQRAMRAWSPHIRAASDRVKGASGRVKVWAQERSARKAHESNEAQGSANPIYILAAITLGIPALLLIPLVGMNPGVQEGTFTIVLTFLVVSAFVTAAVFEIKRLAEQSSDEKHH